MHDTRAVLSALLLACLSFPTASASGVDRRRDLSSPSTQRSTNSSSRPSSSGSAIVTGVRGTNLPASGSGSVYASLCNAAKQTWVSLRGSTFVSATVLPTSAVNLSTSHEVVYSSTTDLSIGATPYTLCDHYTRINGSTSVDTRTETITSSITHYYTTTSSVYANLAIPTCTIDPSDCAALSSTYGSSYAAFESWFTATTPVTSKAPRPSGEWPICGTPVLPTFTVDDPVCALNTASIRLLYWPVTTAANCSLCATTRCPTQTLGPSNSGQPNTFETLSTTLTSPTVYMEILGTWQYEAAGQTLLNQSRFLLPLSSTAVTSLCADPTGGYGNPQQVDYANFNYPVPADAYRCQPKCYAPSFSESVRNITITRSSGALWSGSTLTAAETTTSSYSFDVKVYPSVNLCSTIWDDYAPVLSIPPEFASLSVITVGPYETCSFVIQGNAAFWDPPIALTQGTSIDPITQPGPDTTSAPTTGPTAEPVSVPAQTTPIATSTLFTPSPSTPVAKSPVETVASDHSLATPIDTSPTDTGSPDSVLSTPRDTTHTSQQPATDSPSSQNVGGVIASVIGGGSPTEVSTATNTQGLPTLHTQPVTGVIISQSGGSVVTVLAPTSNRITVGSATLTIGQTTSITGLGTVIAQSTGLVISGILQPFTVVPPPPSFPSDQPVVVTIGLQTITADSQSAFTVSPGATLTPGGIITVSGTTISLDGSASVVVVNGATETLQHASQATSRAAVLTLGGQTITEGSSSDFVLGPGTTLTPGGVITISGTTISLDSSASVVVVNGATQTLQHPSQVNSGAAVLTLGGQTITEGAASNFAFGLGTTLTLGGVITISGTTISVDKSASVVVINGQTETLSHATVHVPSSASSTGSSATARSSSGASSHERPGMALIALFVVLLAL